MENFIIQVQEYIDNTDEEELAVLIDDIFRTRYNNIDSSFIDFYKSKLNMLRYKDALHQQINIIKKHEKKLTLHKKNAIKYNCLMAHQMKIQEMYDSWKKNKEELKIEKVNINIDVESFFFESEGSIRNQFQEDEQQFINLNVIKKLLRENNNKVKQAYKLTEPTAPSFESAVTDLKKISVNLKNSKKSNIELLEEMGKNELMEIVYAIVATWDKGCTSELKVRMDFIFCHWCNCDTKGKEYVRVDTQLFKDPSKTKGKSIQKLFEEYQDIVKKISAESNEKKTL